PLTATPSLSWRKILALSCAMASIFWLISEICFSALLVWVTLKTVNRANTTSDIISAIVALNVLGMELGLVYRLVGNGRAAWSELLSQIRVRALGWCLVSGDRKDAVHYRGGVDSVNKIRGS